MAENSQIWGNPALHEVICLLADKTKPEMRLSDRLKQNDIARLMLERGYCFAQSNWSRLCKQAEAAGIIVSETFGRGTRYAITAAGQLHARQWHAIKAGQDISKPVPSPVKQAEPQAETKLIAAPNPQKTLEECIAEADQREKQPQEAENTPKDGGKTDFAALANANPGSRLFGGLGDDAALIGADKEEKFRLLEQRARSDEPDIEMPLFCRGNAKGVLKADAERGRAIMEAAGRENLPRKMKMASGKWKSVRLWTRKEAKNG